MTVDALTTKLFSTDRYRAHAHGARLGFILWDEDEDPCSLLLTTPHEGQDEKKIPNMPYILSIKDRPSDPVKRIEGYDYHWDKSICQVFRL